jgi:hypothetical protein
LKAFELKTTEIDKEEQSMKWKRLYLIASLALTVSLAACNHSASQNQVAENTSPSDVSNASPSADSASPGDTTQTEAVTDNQTGAATTSSSGNKTKTTANSGTSNKTKTTANSGTSNKKNPTNPCGNKGIYTSEETPGYRVFICGSKNGSKTYVGVSKKDGKSITLPVKETKDGTFEAKNADTTYTLHKNTGSLTVVVKDKKTGDGVAVVNENGRIKPDSGSPTQTTEDTQSKTTQPPTDTRSETTQPPTDTRSETTQPPADTRSETTQPPTDTP